MFIVQLFSNCFYRKITFSIVFTCLFFLFSQHAHATSILLLGDSLSASRGMQQNEGWVYLLNQRFKENNKALNIINASISGETTAGGLTRLPQLLAQNKVDILFVELGGNDGLRGFSPQLIKHNLLQIIKIAQGKNIKVWLMEMKIPPNYGKRYNQLFTNTYQQVSHETNSYLFPFFLEKIAINSKLMQPDGIHPNKKAQPLIAELMYQQIIPLIN